MPMLITTHTKPVAARVWCYGEAFGPGSTLGSRCDR